jgi:enhancer of mRNA-decapping protein 4
MQILGLPVKKEEELDIPKRNQLENIPKETKDKKVVKGQTKKSSKPLIIPSDGGKKITILKREDKSAATKEEAEPNVEGNTDASPVIASSVTKDEIEQIVKKAISAHFHKQETIITSEIQKAVRYEIQSGLIPILNKTVTQTLEQTVTKAMKSDVTKTVKDGMKMNCSELASSVSSQIQDPLVKSFHQTMRNVMIPAYEKGTRQMFEQIASSIETGLELNRKENDDTAKLMDGMMKRMDAMGKTIEVLIKAVAQLQTGSIPTPNHGKAAASPPVDRTEASRRTIIDLLRANQYEKAFTQALSASDPKMALFVCKNSNLSTVLEGERPKLSQPIMLCLMQQLGADLSTDEDLSVKLAWLQSMALILDPQNENVAKHIKGVVQQLVTNLQTKMAQCDPALRRHLQMLLQVIRGIGNS